MGNVKCLNPWDVQSKHIMSTDGISETLYAGECRWGGSEAYVCYCFQQNQREEVRLLGDKAGAITAESGMHNTNYIYVMSERQISMIVAENVSNSIVSTDFKGAQVVCYESKDG